MFRFSLRACLSLCLLSSASVSLAMEEEWHHFTDLHQTADNMSVLITSFSNYPVRSGDEVGAFLDGILVGRGQVDADGRCGIAVWGDDETTPNKDGLFLRDPFELKLWDSHKHCELQLVRQVTGASGLAVLTYTTNTLITMEARVEQVVQALPSECYLQETYPNPFNSSTRLRYGLSAHVESRTRNVDSKACAPTIVVSCQGNNVVIANRSPSCEIASLRSQRQRPVKQS